MKKYQHPDLATISLPDVMQALSDACRMQIVQQLLEGGDIEYTCSEFEVKVCKATRSHHLQVLREAGLIRMRSHGNKCLTSLRRDEVEGRFPGLLDLVAKSSV